MADADGASRTRLEQVLRQRHMTVDDLRKRFKQAAKADLSERQAYRWLGGELEGLPYPHAQAVLEQLFGEPASKLFGPPYGEIAPMRHQQRPCTSRGHIRTDWEGQVIAMSADRARDFLSRAEASNVGAETIDQLTDDVRRLVTEYQRQPLELLLADMVEVQDRAFSLLEGRQRPSQARDLYFLASIASGMMAKSSHDVGAAHDAMTQARAAYACADNCGHDGLRAWIRGLQALIAYWSGRMHESVRYAQQGADVAARSRGTAAIWLASSEARSLAALGRMDDSRDALNRATQARELVRPDEVDELGGLCTFNRPRQLYYGADAMAWGGLAEANHTERLAADAIDAYEHAPAIDRSFGDESGTRCAMAIARVLRGEAEGAAEVLAPVLELPPSQRIRGIVVSVENVRATLRDIEPTTRGHAADQLDEQIEAFSTNRLALPQ